MEPDIDDGTSITSRALDISTYSNTRAADAVRITSQFLLTPNKGH